MSYVWEVDTETHKPSDDPMCDWHAIVRLRREKRSGLYMYLQFGSLGVTEDQAKEIVTNVLAGLNAAKTVGADEAPLNEAVA